MYQLMEQWRKHFKVQLGQLNSAQPTKPEGLPAFRALPAFGAFVLVYLGLLPLFRPVSFLSSSLSL
jgi:hypothetical protein